MEYELLDANGPGHQMDNETMRAQILKYERLTGFWLAAKMITQEDAWDIYFGLLHECCLRDFGKDAQRIRSKIDVTKYNPFASKNPKVVFLAWICHYAKNPAYLN